MYINRALLIILLLIYTFAPMLEQWVISGGSAWYRPYLLWAAIIALVYWSQRHRAGDEL